MGDKGKYIKGFLSGAAIATLIIPKINSKKTKQFIHSSLSKLSSMISR